MTSESVPRWPGYEDLHEFEVIDFRYRTGVDGRLPFLDLHLQRGDQVKRLRFWGPQQLSIEEGFPQRTGGLVLLDHREAQLDGLAVQVSDWESSHGAIRFFARSFCELRDFDYPITLDRLMHQLEVERKVTPARLLSYMSAVRIEPRRWRFDAQYEVFGGRWVIAASQGWAIAWDEFHESWDVVRYLEEGCIPEEEAQYGHDFDLASALQFMRQHAPSGRGILLEEFSRSDAWAIASARASLDDFRGNDWIVLAEQTVRAGDAPEAVVWLAGETANQSLAALDDAVRRACRAMGVKSGDRSADIRWTYLYYAHLMQCGQMDPIVMAQHLHLELGLEDVPVGAPSVCAILNDFLLQNDPDLDGTKEADRLRAETGQRIRDAIQAWLSSETD